MSVRKAIGITQRQNSRRDYQRERDFERLERKRNKLLRAWVAPRGKSNG